MTLIEAASKLTGKRDEIWLIRQHFGGREVSVCEPKDADIYKGYVVATQVEDAGRTILIAYKPMEVEAE